MLCISPPVVADIFFTCSCLQWERFPRIICYSDDADDGEVDDDMTSRLALACR